MLEARFALSLSLAHQKYFLSLLFLALCKTRLQSTLSQYINQIVQKACFYLILSLKRLFFLDRYLQGAKHFVLPPSHNQNRNKPGIPPGLTKNGSRPGNILFHRSRRRCCRFLFDWSRLPPSCPGCSMPQLHATDYIK